MSNPRTVDVNLKYNGHTITTSMKDYIESVSYVDVYSGESDQLDITIQNINMRWLKGKWYPKKGDKIKGAFVFNNWNKAGKKLKLNCGTFIADEIKFSGGPLTGTISCLTLPSYSSFKATERTKTWESVTIADILREIAEKYQMGHEYKAPSITIESLEQSDKSDCSFLKSLCDDYALSIKIFNEGIIIYDQTAQEKRKSIATLKRSSFVNDKWDFIDSIQGTYTGAKISYKSSDDDEETDIYIGHIPENSEHARILNINETADSEGDARRKAAGKLDKANESATKLSGDIWPNPKIVAGATVTVTGMGKINGKYFVEKSTIKVSESGTTQSIEMHKCYKRLTFEGEF